jgi:Raf kinase inhibitor-like YbhB/YbcL family protein
MKSSLLLIPILMACKEESKKNSAESQTASPTEEIGAFIILSNSFQDGRAIPSLHACGAHGGDNVSPELHWENPPEASYFAIVMDDEVSPCGSEDAACKHWGLFNIPGNLSSIAEGLEATEITGLIEGLNYSGVAGYAGPCPPNTHIYKTTLYGLGASMPILEEGVAVTRSQFETEHSSNILAQTTIQATFDPDQ